jgi:hypothetical protein
MASNELHLTVDVKNVQEIKDYVEKLQSQVTRLIEAGNKAVNNGAYFTSAQNQMALDWFRLVNRIKGEK